MPAQTKPNILFVMADDIGWINASCYNHGIMGYQTPNIDRIAKIFDLRADPFERGDESLKYDDWMFENVF